MHDTNSSDMFFFYVREKHNPEMHSPSLSVVSKRLHFLVVLLSHLLHWEQLYKHHPPQYPKGFPLGFDY